METRFKYFRGENVTVRNIEGIVAGNGVVESYDVNKHSYKVWFCYPHSKDKELIELPALLVGPGPTDKLLEKKSKHNAR